MSKLSLATASTFTTRAVVKNRARVAGYTLLLIIVVALPCITFAEDSMAKPTSLAIADGTPVRLRLNQTISSKNARIGDRLKFLVTTDVNVDGFTVVPAGSTASGTVIGVKGKRFFGMGGHLIFTLDTVELVSGERVAMTGRKEVKGRSRSKFMAAGIIATSLFFWPAAPVFLLSRGSDSFALKGTAVTGHIDGAVLVPAADLPKVRDNRSYDFMSFVPARVLNGEGLEGDMVNLLFVAQADDLREAFQRGGWTKVDKSKLAIAWHLLVRATHNAKLPMARFYLFGRVQDYSYALPDKAAIVTRRHHLRIWKTDFEVDGNPVWAGAATHDVAIELRKHGHLISHRIDPQVDAERDFIGENLAKTSFVKSQEYMHAVDPVFEAQTSAGQAYYSDSRILLLDMHQIVSSQSAVPGSITLTMTSTDAEISALLKLSMSTSAVLAFGQAH
jgi:LssY-like putative type I secretion system component LssY